MSFLFGILVYMSSWSSSCSVELSIKKFITSGPELDIYSSFTEVG